MTAAVVALDGVTVAYGATRALEDVSITVGAGERVALVGPSGAGKSTLLSVMGTAVAPTGGDLTLFGHAVAGLGGRALTGLRRRVVTVHQDLDLVGNLMVVHNVNAGRLNRWSTVAALGSLLRPRGVDAVQAALDRLGIGDRTFDRTDTLSGGQRQRVALARVLVSDAELILADEPVSSLDPARAEEVLALLAELAAEEGLTLVASLHAFDLAVAHFDRVVGLRHGRVLFDRPADRVTPADAAALYDLVDDRS